MITRTNGPCSRSLELWLGSGVCIRSRVFSGGFAPFPRNGMLGYLGNNLFIRHFPVGVQYRTCLGIRALWDVEVDVVSRQIHCAMFSSGKFQYFVDPIANQNKWRLFDTPKAYNRSLNPLCRHKVIQSHSAHLQIVLLGSWYKVPWTVLRSYKRWEYLYK